MNIAATQQTDQLNAFNNKMNPYKDIYEQYVDEASFLWILRSVAIEQPHYTRADIFELEQRIQAQLDGLMTSVEDAWDICLDALELEEPGEVFTSTVIAFRSHDQLKIQKALEAGLSSDETLKGLISAMGWLPGNLVHSWIKKFFTSKDLNHKYLAIAACSVRRENPAEYLNRILERDDCKAHVKLYARSLRLIGELRRLDLMGALSEGLKSDNEDIKFWAIWSSILLGNKAEVTKLEPYILASGPNQINAINIAFRVMSVEEARGVISKLAANPEQMRTVIKATGVLGDPHAVNWLISLMANPGVAKLSAEAMIMITGINLEEHQLILETPPNLEQQPNDDAGDTDVSLDEDENLSWPDASKVSQVWMNLGRNFIAGQRYFMGQPISQESLNNKVDTGYQRQRHAAAMELALSNSAMPLQNTRARVVI